MLVYVLYFAVYMYVYMYVFTVFKLYICMCVPLYSAKGIDDVALNKKIKFV